MTDFSVSKNGKVLDPRLYTWDENTKTFSTNEHRLVLDFTDVSGVTFKTGTSCTFYTGSHCTFKTGDDCTFKTGHDCTFNTGSYCTFNTGFKCTFNTDSDCTFKTSYSCAFKTNYDCAFNTGFNCTFEVGVNCCLIRYDIEGVTEIPPGKKIKLNGYGIAGYTVIEKIIEEKKEPPTCNGKVVEIEGKKYQLTEIKE
jgi:hypothetical protein